MTELKAIPRAPSLADDVAAALLARIVSGEWAVHARLPAEKALAAGFGVSRAVVREAIARLKAEGYLTTRQGKGAFVAAPEEAAPSGPGRKPDAAAPASGKNGFRLPPAVDAHLLELRTLIECDCAELAALRHTEADLAAMRQALADMRQAIEAGGLGLAEDIRFHEALAQASGNPVLARFAQYVGRGLRETMQLARLSKLRYEDRLDDIEREHQAILKAVAAGDGAEARMLLAGHIAKGKARLGLAAHLAKSS
ncbi:FadR/GntR family transcriptional regulator [Ferrovibrio sp.]|uniref:FadR/GntR family transcriptional regulator n=1 Tax=Ferrovibrio sp. TaxID=1917215 RepID=UPI003D0C2C44